MAYSLLQENIRNNLEMSNSELEFICKYFKPMNVDKGDFILRQGNICRFEGFVTEGCFRIFNIDDEGNENTLYFAVRDWWLMDNDSFMNQVSSELNIQAIEDSKVLIIDRAKKEALFNESPVVEKLFRIMSQKAVAAWQRRLIRNHCMTAKDRYSHFVNVYPNIAQKLTDRQISGYLGITHEFLSKIKRKK